MIDFKNAFLAMELLSQRSSNQVIQEAFPDLDEHMFKHLLDKYIKYHTPWGFYAAIDSDLQQRFDQYLHKVADVPYLPFNEWQFPEFPVPFSSAKGGVSRSLEIQESFKREYPLTEDDCTKLPVKHWRIKNSDDTLFLAIARLKHKGQTRWTNDIEDAETFESTDDAQMRVKRLPELLGPYIITRD